MRECLRLTFRRDSAVQSSVPGALQGAVAACDAAQLESRLDAADLVICQVGCLSHGEYWRVEDHCRRTGKTCVLVERPEAVGVVRISVTEPAAEVGPTTRE